MAKKKYRGQYFRAYRPRPWIFTKLLDFRSWIDCENYLLSFKYQFVFKVPRHWSRFSLVIDIESCYIKLCKATHCAITQPCKDKVITQPSSKHKGATFQALYLRYNIADWYLRYQRRYLRYQISVFKSSWYEFYGNVCG
jgi:hypothetical protein